MTTSTLAHLLFHNDSGQDALHCKVPLGLQQAHRPVNLQRLRLFIYKPEYLFPLLY